jgi:hypothetical protein
MRLRYALTVVGLFVTLAGNCRAQERFESGCLKGFTKSPTEHIIDEPDKPFTVRTAKGIVLDPSGAEMDGVIVELRNEKGEIRGTKTNRRGALKLGGVPEGTYKLKVTMNGFQSLVGDIVVSKKAKDADLAKIVMKVGL